MHAVGLVGSLLTDSRRSAARGEAEELRELVRAKSDFLRLTVHEFRGPLGRLTGYLSLIRDGDLGEVPGRLVEALGQMEAARLQMVQELDSLAAVARLEDGAEVLRIRPCLLRDVIAQAIRDIEEEAVRRTVRIDQDLGDPDLELSADPERLLVAIRNLVANAVNYGPGGSIVTIRGWQRSRGVAIAVSDQGPGLDPEETARLFDAHWRGRQAASVPGLGLGLQIVRRIVELHQGVVTVESPTGGGTTFTIVLPIER
jgi:two-component system phosphate regulon sensor histidine kinase PhoR